MQTIRLGGLLIGAERRCLIIAEAGVNHNGSSEMAFRLIDAAQEAGADAVKFQTFRAKNLVVEGTPKAGYQQAATGGDESQADMLRRLELDYEVFRKLAGHCRSRGILFLSTPFDEDGVDFLADLGMEAFKTPSGEITNLNYLAHIARKGRPMIVSTGMSTLAEVGDAVNAIREAGNPPLILLHCVSSYPAEPADANLRAMTTLADTFGVPVGFSDHTLGLEVPLAAVALGACVIEKHFTLDRNLPGPDHRASCTPQELAALVRSIRIVEAALGTGIKQPAAVEADTARAARKSLVAATAIPAGTRVEKTMVTLRRPGTGMPPAKLAGLLGRTARVAIAAGTLLQPEMFD